MRKMDVVVTSFQFERRCRNDNAVDQIWLNWDIYVHSF